jgi:hypothetical protein
VRERQQQQQPQPALRVSLRPFAPRPPAFARRLLPAILSLSRSPHIIYIYSCTNKCTVSCCCWPFAPLMQSYGLDALGAERADALGEMIIIITRLPAPPLCSHLARIFRFVSEAKRQQVSSQEIYTHEKNRFHYKM